MQARDGAEDRGEHQRHHDHLQQLHVAVAHDIEPANRGFQHVALRTVNGLQRQAEQHADHQTDQHFFRQAPAITAEARQQQQQRDEGCEIENQR